MRFGPGALVRVGTLNMSDVVEPHVMTFKHTARSNGGREAEIVIENVNLDLIDHPQLFEGVEVQYRFGYPENLSPLYIGKATSIIPNFDAGAGLTLTIIVNDAVAEMLKKERQKIWKQIFKGKAQITESEVVKRIAADLGLTADVEETKTMYSQLSQSGYDWDFIQELAVSARPLAPNKQTAYVAWIDETNKILHFKPAPLEKGPKRKYKYFTENEDLQLLRFEPRTKTNTPDDTGKDDTTSKAVNPNPPVEKKNVRPDMPPVDPRIVDNYARNETNPNRLGVGKYIVNEVNGKIDKDGSGENPDRRTISGKQDGDLTTQDQLYNLDNTVITSENDHQTSELNTVEADLEVLGDPQLDVNDMVEIINVGKRYSGVYYLDEITQTITPDNGYVTSAAMRRNATPVSSAHPDFKGLQVNAHGESSDGKKDTDTSQTDQQGEIDPVTGTVKPPKKGN